MASKQLALAFHEHVHCASPRDMHSLSKRNCMTLWSSTECGITELWKRTSGYNRSASPDHSWDTHLSRSKLGANRSFPGCSMERQMRPIIRISSQAHSRRWTWSWRFKSPKPAIHGKPHLVSREHIHHWWHECDLEFGLAACFLVNRIKKNHWCVPLFLMAK